MKEIITTKRSLALLLTILLTSFCFAERASAKAPTVKITISGGGLARAIEITDRQVLALSNVWIGDFLDVSRTPESEAPKSLVGYEVSFFVRVAEDYVKKVYVVYYYPMASNEQGFVYLPIHGTARHLNAGTILREGLDGKWNYASPAWEALIKPTLDRARLRLPQP